MQFLCVCRGNLCRSPMAAAVLRAKANRAGITLSIDSAGTATWHDGDPADPSAVATAERNGYPMVRHHARRITAEDFYRADLILAMDTVNLDILHHMAPVDGTAMIEPFHPAHDLHDPYYEGPAEFEAALELIEDGADILVARLLSAQTLVENAVMRPQCHQLVAQRRGPAGRRDAV